MITLETVKSICSLVATGMFVIITTVTTLFVTKKANEISFGVEQVLLETKETMSNANKAALDIKEGASNFNKMTLDLKKMCEDDIIGNIKDISVNAKAAAEDIKSMTNEVKGFMQSVAGGEYHTIVREAAYSYGQGRIGRDSQKEEKTEPKPVEESSKSLQEEKQDKSRSGFRKVFTSNKKNKY